jgi:uncharacterized protein
MSLDWHGCVQRIGLRKEMAWNRILILLAGVLLSGSAIATDGIESEAERLARLAALGDQNGLRLMLDSGVSPMLQEPRHGATALHNAAAQGHLKLVQLLLERGASLASEDHTGATPLIYAAYQGRTAIIELLLKHGAAVDHLPAAGPTAMTAACLRGHEAIVRLLLQAGAAPELADANGLTPRAAAELGARAGIIALIVQAERESAQ